ncbi:MAG: hypothetical protein K0U59_09380 [Gammaproteobacteria bacterium]|nr:hypothetical protein [Gammaproteobacteria bacterium]
MNKLINVKSILFLIILSFLSLNTFSSDEFDSVMRADEQSAKMIDSFITLYEGNDGSQNIVCTIDFNESKTINFQSDALGCDNDEARSAILFMVPAGTLFIVYDSPSGSREDDFTIVRIKQDIPLTYTINSFEGNVNDNYIEMQYFRNNGLDGKISSITIDIKE